MTLGLSDQRRRSHRRRSTLRVIIMLLVVVGAGVIGYRFGIYSAERPVYELEDTIEILRAETLAMNSEIHDHVQLISKLKGDARNLQERYNLNVPNEDERKILETATRKLAEGVTYQRLAFVINGVQNERQCSGQLTTKRFIVETPMYRGGNNSVIFGNGALTVSAYGVSARTEIGEEQQWYDPRQPVKINFTHVSGQLIEIEGMLPLQKSFVVGNTEYRFNLTHGPQSFVYVSGDTCAYP